MSNEEIVAEIQDGVNVQSNMEKLYFQNIGLINQYAKHYFTLCEPEDLMQEAYIGLHNAAMKYDSEQGKKFSTYLGFWIRQSFQRYCENYSKSIRVPAYQQDLVHRYIQLLTQYENTNQSPDDSAICKELKINMDQLLEVKRIMNLGNIDSLSRVISDDNDHSLADILPDNSFKEDASRLSDREEIKIQNILSQSLDAREMEIITGLYWNNMSTSELVNKLQIDKRTVFRKHSSILKKLQKNTELQAIFDYNSSKAYWMGVRYAMDNFTSSTEMLAIKRLELGEEQEQLNVKQVKLDMDRLKRFVTQMKSITRKILNDRYYRILIQRISKITLEEIAEQEGISRERVRQIENAALKKIRANAEIQEIKQKILEILSHYDIVQYTEEMKHLKNLMMKVGEE